jgi:hypothetical protein
MAAKCTPEMAAACKAKMSATAAAKMGAGDACCASKAAAKANAAMYVLRYNLSHDLQDMVTAEKHLAESVEHYRELTRLTEAFAILSAPDTKEVSFGEEQPKPKGKVFMNASQGVLLIASNLPPAPAGKLYEMWVIPKGGAPRPAGTFQSGPQGTAMHILNGVVDSSVTLAVTVEPDTGSPAPTSDILFSAGF